MDRIAGTRRQFLRSCGVAAAGSLAGCGSGTAEPSRVELIPDGGADPGFGTEVALAEDVAVIGSTPDDSDSRETGSAYVFERSDGSWMQATELTASDGDPDDSFGASVAVTENTVLVSASGDEDPNGTLGGSAYVFERVDGDWKQDAKLTLEDGDPEDLLGTSVALDGDVALLGAGTDEDPNGDNAGAAYVFERSGREWTRTARLAAADGERHDWFGRDVSLSGDRALVGAHFEDENGDRAGAAYVFRRTEKGWTQESKLLASDGSAEDGFGQSVSLVGETALVGAPGGRTRDLDVGAAYVFVRSNGRWRQRAKLDPETNDVGPGFGTDVALSRDRALVGANDAQSDDAGGAHLFERSENGWPPSRTLASPDGRPGFGYAVAIRGRTPLVGANGKDTSQPGSAYVFEQ